MSNDASSQSKGPFAFWRELRGYLNTEVIVGAPELVKSTHPYEVVEIKVKVCNTAPDDTNEPTIVFAGVGLDIAASREGRRVKLQQWARTIEKVKVDTPSGQDELSSQEESFSVAGSEFPKITPDEQRHGDVLFPGESIIYKLTIATQDLPRIKFCIRGTVSRRHLLHFQKTLTIPST